MKRKHAIATDSIVTEADLEAKLNELNERKERRSKHLKYSAVRSKAISSLFCIVTVLGMIFIPGFRSFVFATISNGVFYGIVLAISFRILMQSVRTYREYRLEDKNEKIRKNTIAQFKNT